MLASGPTWDLFITIQPLGHKKRSTYISLYAQPLDPLTPSCSLSTSLCQLGLPHSSAGLREQMSHVLELQPTYTIPVSKTGRKAA